MKNILSGVFFLVIGAVFMIGSMTYDLGSVSQPGPGFFPLLVSTCVAIIGVLIIIWSIFGNIE